MLSNADGTYNQKFLLYITFEEHNTHLYKTKSQVYKMNCYILEKGK